MPKNRQRRLSLPKYLALGDDCKITKHKEVFLFKLRQHLVKSINQAIVLPSAAIIKSLVLGGSSYLSAEQRNLLQYTGTSHLVAISGLHVGLLISWVRIVFRYMLSRWLVLFIYGGAILDLLAWLFAACYVCLAHFPVAANRALLMVLIVILLRWLGVARSKFFSLYVASFGLLVWQPFVLLQAGFWLSCLGVFLLLNSEDSDFWQVCGNYLLLFVGFSIVNAWFFDAVSINSIVANMIVIPVFSFWVIPFSLFGALCFQFSQFFSMLCWQLAAQGVDWVWPLLKTLSQYGYFKLAKLEALSTSLAFFGVVLVLRLPNWRFGYWALCWCLPLFFSGDKLSVSKGFVVSVLDVGQGLSILIKTRQHALLYDAGGRYKSWDAGRDIIAPYLLKLGVDQIDKLIISHGDMDHRGGASYLYHNFFIKTVLSSEPERLTVPSVHCFEGQSWCWDGVCFKVLSPSLDSDWRGNRRSCVVLIDDGVRKVLLTGDIDITVEKWLINKYPIKVEGLVVPHHGSLTASSGVFLDNLKPSWAVISAGRNNKFHLPNKAVVERYLVRGIKVFNTQAHGDITK